MNSGTKRKGVRDRKQEGKQKQTDKRKNQEHAGPCLLRTTEPLTCSSCSTIPRQRIKTSFACRRPPPPTRLRMGRRQRDRGVRGKGCRTR